MNCGICSIRRGVWLGFPLGRGDVPRADEVPVVWGKEMKAYGEFRTRRLVLEKWDALNGL
jgi:hypothetical protein